MDAYERLANTIIQRMKQEIKTPFRLASMIGPTSCKVGDLVLEREDLTMLNTLNHITVKYGDRFLEAKESVQEFEKGEEVLLYKENDSKYIILGRVKSL